MMEHGCGRSPPERFTPHVDYGLGTYGVIDAHHPTPDMRVSVGRYCSIAPGATALLRSNHRPDFVTTYPFAALGWDAADPLTVDAVGRGPVTVGSDVWLGWQCVLMPGVTVGHGAVVGTRAIVTKDVPPYAIVAGNPARIIRHRFPVDVVERLLRVAWWDWPVADIKRHVRLLQQDDMSSFLAAAEAYVAQKTVPTDDNARTESRPEKDIDRAL